MSIRSVTWQQLAVLVVCLAAAFAAHKYLGVTEGMTAGVVTSIIAFLLGRPSNTDSSPPRENPASPKDGAS